MHILVFRCLLVFIVCLTIYGFKKEEKASKYSGVVLLVIIILSDLLAKCNF